MIKIEMEGNNTDNSTAVPMSPGSTTLDPRLVDFAFYSEAYIQTVILIFGFAFNVINYIVLTRTKITETFRICLLALTLTDACACVFGTVQLIVESVEFRGDIPFGYWYGGALASHLLYYIFLMFLCTSSIYVILVAAVRAHMIAQPYKSAEHLKPRRLKLICVIIMATTATLFLPSPLYAMWQVCYAKDNTSPVCVDYFKRLPNVEYMKFYFYALSLLFGPLVIIANIVCLIVIYCALKKSQARSDRLTKKEEKQQKYYKRITKMLLIILIFDIVWLTPTCMQYLGLVFSPEDTVFNSTDAGFIIFDIIAEVLLLFRPSYNIFVYLATNREYLRSFKELFCCKDDKDGMSTELNNSSSANNQFINHHVNQGITPDKMSKSDSTATNGGIREQDIYIVPRKDGDL